MNDNSEIRFRIFEYKKKVEKHFKDRAIKKEIKEGKEFSSSTTTSLKK